MTIEYKDSKRIVLNEADRTLVQGNSGGYGTPSSVSSRGAGGGGGGASSAGVSADGTTSGSNGGAGYNNSISGTSTGYAGGGAGAVDNTTGSGTASHGANNSGAYPSNNADANTGAGGSGGGNDTGTNYTGGAGGSGIVIIRFTTSGNGYSQAGGTVDSSTVSGQTIISWTATSGTRTFTPTSSFNVEYLVIGGGGSGGNRQHGGGGGSGAYRTSTSHAVTAQAYTIVVGAGGASPVGSSNTNGNNGSDSSFDNITSIGGGYGGTFANLGGSGGSGGGGGATSASTLASGTSSDVPLPTNVQDNSILVEKDTGRRYWFDLGVEPKGTSGTGGDWAEASFNASSAVGGATTSGNVVTRTSGSGWNSYIRSNEYISPSTGGGEIYFTHSNTANVSVGLEKSPFNSAPTAVYTGKDYSFHTTTASNNMYEGTSDYAGTAWASATNEFRITMDSAGLVKYYWRSGSSGTWTLERTSTVTASGDYYMAVSPASGTTTCFIKGTPATWTMNPTIEDDLTTNNGWVFPTNSSYDSTNDQIDLTIASSSFDVSYIDLQKAVYFGSGNNLDDDKFIIRARITKNNNLSYTSKGSSLLLQVSSALTDSSKSPNPQDAVGIRIDTNRTNGANYFYVHSTDNGTFWNGESASGIAYDWQTGDLYWEIIGDGTNVTGELFTGSDYSTGSLGKATTSQQSPTGMRYLKFCGFNDPSRTATQFSLQDFIIYNGVTTPN